ncbi:anaerobic sulfatase maturase [Clostridiales bacterium COT073_COT-073]|nr:anaerobic sulfatase maturase [Clostridiales bacterium COT073_COT-073]
MPPIHLLIKPASAACNMVCEYCFYNDVAANRLCGFKGFMSEELLENLVKDALSHADGICGFAFQGGEPTLVGLDFYRRLIEFQQKHNHKKLRIHNSIQTNGFAINAEWAEFFRSHQFLVGLSLDGTRQLHDHNRHDKKGSGTFARVMETARLFDEYQVAYNILSVVTGQNARHIESSYRFFRKQGFEYLQFIPCLEPFADEKGNAGYALTIEDYQYFLTKLFDLWFLDLKQGKYISIRHLDNWIGILLGRPPEACSMQGRCSVQFVVEGNGEVYPCDFYVLDQWLLGKIGENSLAQMQTSETAKRFIAESVPLPEDCKSCRYVQLCRNGCKRERALTGEQNVPKLYYCQAVKGFFSSREKELEEAAAIILRMVRGQKQP